MASRPRVELLWWRECPSWERALAILREVMAEAELDPNSIEVVEVDTEEAAARQSFTGSPTIRVNGEDVQPPIEGEPTGLACRVYRRRDGRTSPLPETDDVREALRSAVGR